MPGGIAYLQVFDQDGVLNPMGLQKGFDCLDAVSGDSHVHRKGRGGRIYPEIKLKRDRKKDLVWGKRSANRSSKALEMLISPKLNDSCSIVAHHAYSTLHSLAWPHHNLVSVNVTNSQ